VDFSKGGQKDSSKGKPKSSEITFFPLEAKKTTFFLLKLSQENVKFHNSRGQGYPLPKVVRRPWAPRTSLEFAVKTGYVLDPWKMFCCPWVYFDVHESTWTVVKLFFIELLITLNQGRIYQ